MQAVVLVVHQRQPTRLLGRRKLALLMDSTIISISLNNLSVELFPIASKQGLQVKPQECSPLESNTNTMDHYPEVTISERECASRQPSNASSLSKTQLAQNTRDGQLAPPVYTSFPPPGNTSEQEQQEQRLRTDSVHSNSSISATKSKVEADLKQYTNAPPPYSAKQYEGKSEEVQNKMRMADYAKELKRMMGRQLAKGIKNGDTKA